jgi:hypothetical protein
MRSSSTNCPQTGRWPLVSSAGIVGEDADERGRTPRCANPIPLARTLPALE